VNRPASRRTRGHLLREDIREAVLGIVVAIVAGLLLCAVFYYF